MHWNSSLFLDIISFSYQRNNNTLFNDKLGFEFECNDSYVDFNYENKHIMVSQSNNLKKLRLTFQRNDDLTSFHVR